MATDAEMVAGAMNYYGTTATLVSLDATHPSLAGHDAITWHLATQVLQTVSL